MSDTTGTPFNTERKLAEDQPAGDDAAQSPADASPPDNPPVDEDALRKGLETLERVKPY